MSTSDDVRCAVCQAPAAPSLHFGTRSCKACAAFFRRTVALDIVFECSGKNPPCTVHYEKPMRCRRCRFEKCLEAKMQKRMVLSRKNVCDDSPPTSSSDPSEPTPSTSELSGSSPSDEELVRLTRHYVKMEAALNDRRKIMHTDSLMRDVFGRVCECPFERRNLREFDYRNSVCHERTDFIMLYDYANSFPRFDELQNEEKNVLYRFACGVDCIMNGAFYSSRLGMQENIMVFTTGEYLNMDPLPLTGSEPDIERYFSSKEDMEKYKAMVSPKVAYWKDFVIPFYELQVTFEEFSLLKPLATLLLSYCKLLEAGRFVCQEQKTLIVSALNRLCRERGVDPVERVGSLLLLLSSVFVGQNIRIPPLEGF